MPVAKNPITGDNIQTKNISDQYRDNWDRIFGRKDESESSSQAAQNATVQAADSSTQEAQTT